MQDNDSSIATPAEPRDKGGLFTRLNDQAKRLNDVKVNVVTVVIFIAFLGVLTFTATGISYLAHHALRR
jgi:hypothetical protein